jgi:cell division septal protein FtsQ
MSRIVEFPEGVSPHMDQPPPPTERFRLKKRHQQQKRRKLWFKAKIGLRLGLLVVLVGVWAVFPALPFWRFKPQQTTITGTNALVTPDDINQFLRPFRGQSLLTINPATLSTQLKAQLPLIYDVWFRRQLGGQLAVHLSTQKPWARLMDNGRVWGVFTDRYQILPLAQLPERIQARLNMTDVKPEAPDPKPSELGLSGPHNDAAESLVTIQSPASATWLEQPAAREQLALVLQQINALKGITLVQLDMTNPINMVATFDRFDVALGQLDRNLTRKRLPRLVHLIEPIVSGAHGTIDRIDLRWDKEVTFHRVEKPVTN